MKKTMLLMSAVAVAAAALVSCNKEQDVKIEEPKGIAFEITAGTVDTKTANDDVHTTWVAGDKINLFHAEKDTDSYVSDGTFTAAADGASVAFSGTLGEALDGEKNYDWYALYPYEDDYGNSPESFDYVTIGSLAGETQVQAGNNSKAHLAGVGYPLWGRRLNIAAATKPAITLNQMTAIIAVNVTNKIASGIKVSQIQFSASSELSLIGTFRADFHGTSPALENAAVNPVATLDVTGAATLATDASAIYYMAVKPFEAPAGSKLTIVVTTDQGSQTLSNIVPANYNFAAGKIYTLSFNFTNKTVNLAEFKYNDSSWLSAQGIALPAENGSTNLEGAAQTVNPIVVTSTDGGTKTRVFNSGGVYDLRVYNGGSLTIAATNDNFISKITIAGKNITNLGLATANTWTGKQVSVHLPASGTANINTINVFYQACEATDHLLEVPITSYNVAYNSTSQGISFYKANVDDMVITSTSDGYIDNSVAGNTITVNFSANAGSSPRDIVVNISSAKAGFDEDITITQAGAPATISTLSDGNAGTVTAQVAALTTNGFVIADNTGAIFVYKSGQGVSIGQTVTVSGTVGNYNKCLQFPSSCTVTKGDAGSYSYGPATTFTSTEITDWNSDTSNRLASYVTMTGVAKKNGSNIDLIVGGGSTANATLYYPVTTHTTGLAEGDNITVTGYAVSVMSSKCGIIPTAVVNNETTPKIVFTDVTGVAAAGVTDANLTVSPFRIDGWTPNVSHTGCVTAATINSACTTVTYSVGNNDLSTPQAGTIVVTFKKGGESDVVYTINVAQLGKTATLSGTINFGSASGSTKINGASIKGDDSLGNEWTVTTVGTTSFTQNAAYSQVGKSAEPAESITLTTTLAASKTIKSFSTSMGGFSGTEGTVTLKVGTTPIGSGSLNGTSNVTVESNSEATGTVLTITVTGIAKGVKIASITYEYYNN